MDSGNEGDNGEVVGRRYGDYDAVCVFATDWSPLPSFRSFPGDRSVFLATFFLNRLFDYGRLRNYIVLPSDTV